MSLNAEATTSTVHLRSRSPRRIPLAHSALSVEVEEVPRASLPSVAGRLGEILLARAANASVNFDPSDPDAADMFSQLELGEGPGKTVLFVARTASVPLRRKRKQGLNGLEDVDSGSEGGVEREGDERRHKRKEEKRKGEMIGSVQLAFHTTPDEPTADVRHLLVHPVYERRGVARKLMAKLEAEAKASKIKLLVSRDGGALTPAPRDGPLPRASLFRVPGLHIRLRAWLRVDAGRGEPSRGDNV